MPPKEISSAKAARCASKKYDDAFPPYLRTYTNVISIDQRSERKPPQLPRKKERSYPLVV
jgi:hypothetical protein